jgi:hypothetical protein
MPLSSSDSDLSLSEAPYTFKPNFTAVSFQTLSQKKKEQEELDYYIKMYEEEYAPSRSPLSDIQNNDNPTPPIPSAVLVPKKKPAKDMTCWPHMKSLMRDYDWDVYWLLLGAYETNAMEEPTAKDGPNIKNNAWNKYHDHAFGGGEPERGLIKYSPQSKNLLLSRKRSFRFGDMVH